MAKDVKIVRRAFNAGEVSPQFNFRNDTEKHAFACSRLENFYVSPLGGISRREGTRLLGVLGSTENADNVRLLPFEYNREFSYLLALHTSDAEGKITWTTEPFEIPSTFSICFIIPKGFSTTKTILTKDNLKISFGSDRKLQITDGAKTLTSTAALSADVVNYVVYTCSNGSVTLYVNSVARGALTGMSFSGEVSELVLNAMSRGDTWGLKVFNFDLASTTAPYTLADFSNNVSETGLLSVLPDYAGATSAHGSLIEYSEGKISFTAGDFEAARAKRTPAYTNWVYSENSQFCPTLSYADGKFTSTPPAERLSEQYEPKLSTPINMSAGDTIVIDVGDDYDASAGVNVGFGLSSGIIAFNLDGTEGGSTLVAGSHYEIKAPANAGYLIFGIPVVEDEDPYLSGGFTLTVKAATATDTIKFAMPITAGASVSLETEDEFLAKNTSCYLATKANPDASIEDLVSSSGGRTLNFQASKTSELIVIKAVLTENPEDTKFDGGFNFEAEYSSILASLGSQWASDKIINLDLYDVDGGLLAKDVATPIPSDVLHEFQYKQVNGYLYVAHSSFAPKRFEFSVTDGQLSSTWTEAASFHPSLDTPEDGVILTYGTNTDANKKAVVLSGASGTITANQTFFTTAMIGSQLKLEYSDKGQHTYKWAYRKANNGQRDGYYIGATTIWFTPSGRVTVKPEGGVWEGVLILEESIDNGSTWAEIGRSSAIQGSENTQFEREVYNVRSIVRAKLLEQSNVADTSSTKVEASTEGCFFNIYTESTCNAWVEIQTVSADGKSATVKFLNPARAYFVTDKVYKSAWSDTFGFPRTVDIHEERLTLGGTYKQPSTVWLSQTNNWDNFRSLSNLDTDPLAYTLASDDGEPIAWIVSKSDLMIGLGSSEWSLGSRDASQSLTAKIVHASNQSEDGVEYIAPAKAGNMVIYVRRGNRELGSITYDFASDAYNAISLTTMNPEILGNGIKSIFNQLSPKNQIFAIRNDGVVSVFTYDKENNVAAWSRFLLGDGVISACALSTGGFKSVFFIVRRNNYMCLERLDPNEMETGNWLDCVPISDAVEIPAGLETGVRYGSYVKTTPIFAEGHIKVMNLEFMMLNSYGGKYRLTGWTANGEPLDDENDWRNITMKSADLLAKPTPRDYRYFGNCDSGYLEEAAIEIKTDEPSPFTLCAMAIKAGGI